MTPDYDDSDLTCDEMIELAQLAFDDADNAGPIPGERISSTGDNKAPDAVGRQTTKLN